MNNSHLLRIVIVITLMNLAAVVNTQMAIGDIKELRNDYNSREDFRIEAINLLRGLSQCEDLNAMFENEGVDHEMAKRSIQIDRRKGN